MDRLEFNMNDVSQSGFDSIAEATLLKKLVNG